MHFRYPIVDSDRLGYVRCGILRSAGLQFDDAQIVECMNVVWDQLQCTSVTGFCFNKLALLVKRQALGEQGIGLASRRDFSLTHRQKYRRRAASDATTGSSRCHAIVIKFLMRSDRTIFRKLQPASSGGTNRSRLMWQSMT